VLALLRGNDQGWGSTAILAELTGAALLMVAFVAIESNVLHPMLPLRHFRGHAFTAAQVGAFAISRRSSPSSSTRRCICRTSVTSRRSTPGSSTCRAR